ncbi:MAG: hypothetical protein QNK05_06085 [Myxococcota bacterium]|nr:hypothetical protein [Myxococcota bacterium]
MRTTLGVLVFCLLGSAGCNGPLAFLPGGALRGPEGQAESWEVARGFDSLVLETRPADPYSVRIGFVLRDGRLYVDPAEERTWYAHLAADPAVRVRFDETIYRASAIPVTDPAELEGFDPSRRIFRLELAP